MCKDQNTVVSVIIPTFNVEKYVEQCLRSLLEQTFREFEVICVDDGSSDGTIEIIKRIQAEDDRICLIEKEHCGRAGVMRNIGLEEARGEYCLFLDADDFFEKEMIDRVLTKIREDQADICLFDARLYNEKTKKYKDIDYILQKDYLPEILPFEGRTFPYIFNVTSGCPWSKMFKKSLIDTENIRFMDLPRSNDVYFVFLAMVLAKRITAVRQVFVNYRQSGESLQANNARSPWNWYEALKKLKNDLVRRDLYEKTETSFKNLVFGVSIYNLCSLKSAHVFSEVYEKLQKEVFAEFELEDFRKEQCYSYNEKKSEIYCDICRYDVKEYMFREIMGLKEEKSYWLKRAKKAEQELKGIKESTTFKTGQCLLAVPRKLKKIIKH